LLRGIYDNKDKYPIFKTLPKPSILPTVSGCIDISWMGDDYSLLISVLENEEVYFDIYTYRNNYHLS
jgi:hypothetical protein